MDYDRACGKKKKKSLGVFIRPRTEVTSGTTTRVLLLLGAFLLPGP